MNKPNSQGSRAAASCSLALSTLWPLFPLSFHTKRPGEAGARLPYLVEVPQGHDLGYRPPAELLFHPELDLLVPLHGEHIESIGQQQQQALPPGNEAIQEEDDEHGQVKDVEGDITEQGPPGEIEDLPREKGAGADNKKDVEDSRAHDGTDTHIAVGDKDANERSEELRGGASGGHEGGPSHILRDLQLVCDDSQGWDKVLIAHNGQGHKHVDHAEDVQGHPALSPILHTEQVRGVLGLGVEVWPVRG